MFVFFIAPSQRSLTNSSLRATSAGRLFEQPDQFSLSEHVTFDRLKQSFSVRAGLHIEGRVERKKLEVIMMRFVWFWRSWAEISG